MPPAALCIHLCIGMAYGFSVFWLPLSRAIGLTAPKACPDMSLVQELFTTTCDWKVASLGWMFTLFFVVLGVSAAIWGGWLERVGPRKAGFVAALCWGGGLVLGAIGIYVHQLWIMWLGAGVIGGIGLGLGYISPVSTLIKWFPDHRGMATGMAIMGFGGGAMIGAPLANILINYFKTPTSVGVWQTFADHGRDLFRLHDDRRVRLPRAAGRLAAGGLDRRRAKAKAMISHHNVHLDNAHKTPQFWLIWWVLTLNVSAGIGVIGMASPMLQEIFAGKLIGLPDVGFNALSVAQKATIAGDRGRLYRPALAVQHRRPLLLGVAVRLYRPQEHLLLLLPARHRALCAGADLRGDGLEAAVRARLRHHPVDVWRRLRHRAGLSRRHVRHAVRRRHPRPAADGVVDRRHHRSGGRELHPRIPARGRRAARPALQHHHVHPVRDADRGLDLQLSDQAGRSEVAHERSGSRETAGGTAPTAALPVGSRSGSARAVSTPRLRCSGPLSAFRWPGASGSRCRARPRSSDRSVIAAGRYLTVPRCFAFPINQSESDQGNTMLRTPVCLAAMLLVAGSLHTASAQTTPPPAAAPAADAKPSRMKLTRKS